MTVRPAAMLILFLTAGLVRTAYSLACHALLGVAGVMGADSHAFLRAAQFLADGGSVMTAPLPGTTGFPVDMMPVPFLLMSWLLTPGTAPDPLAFVLLQAWIDAGTCLLIGALAHRLWPGTFLLAALLAAFNPTQIVMAGLYYTDTLFTFFAAAGLLAAMLWLVRPRWVLILALGLAWGPALMTRPFIQYWVLIAAGILFAAAAFKAPERWLHHAAQCIAMLTVCAAIASPIALRNYDAYGTLRLSAQSGAHLLFWVLPLVTEFEDGTPRDAQNARWNEKLEKDEIYRTAPHVFAQSDYLTAIATQELSKTGFAAIASVWVKGAVLNLLAPASTISPPVSTLPRDGFFATPGENLKDKVWAFLFENKGAAYARILLASAAPMPFLVVFAIIGFVACLRRGREPAIAALLLFLWAGYTLGINGPVISPKYRLPLEPAWIVFAAAGIFALRGWLQRRQAG